MQILTFLSWPNGCLCTESGPMCMQMLAFSQLPYLLLSDTALGFWTALLQQASPRGESVAKLEKPPLPLDVAAALIELAGGPSRLFTVSGSRSWETSAHGRS